MDGRGWGELGMGYQWLAGFVYERKIMIWCSGGAECSRFESRFTLYYFFSLVEIFLSSRRMSVHNEIRFHEGRGM